MLSVWEDVRINADRMVNVNYAARLRKILVRGLGDSVTIPKELLKELHEGLIKIEEVLATLEELTDEEGMRRIRRAEEEYRRAEYVVVESGSDVEKLIK